MKGDNNPMKRPEVRKKQSENNRMKRPGVAKSVKEKWAKMSEEERAEARAKNSKGVKKYWANLSEEERRLKLLQLAKNLAKKPNTSEKHIDKIVSPLGFRMNVKGGKLIGDHRPDFIHECERRVIEYDGFAGHNPAHPWTPDTWEDCLAKDDRRDQSYRSVGYYVLRIFREDLKEGDDFVRTKVMEWMYNG